MSSLPLPARIMVGRDAVDARGDAAEVVGHGVDIGGACRRRPRRIASKTFGLGG